MTAAPRSAAAWLSDEVVLVVDDGGEVSARWCAADVDDGAVTDLRALLREHVAVRTGPARAELLAALTALMADPRASESLPGGLHLAREVLRERLPLAVVDAAAPQLLHVERLHRVSERDYVVQGWCAADVACLTAVAPEGMRADLAERMFRYPRPDVEEFLGTDRPARAPAPFGFVACFALDAPSRLRDGWVLELRDAAGRGVETAPLPVEADPAVVRDALLRDLSIARGRNAALLDDHVRPALGALHARRVERVGIRDVDDFGSAPHDPALSLVVPLYGRIDLLEHQLVHFADDPELAGCELIYVLDSPELAEELRTFAAQLHALYRLPFRVVTLTENGGFSVATNLGASVARGERLLLLNSDVVPAAPGWTGRMLDFYEQTPGIGALAPKLVYEDDAIQHAGIYFERRPGGREWWNEHFYKGVHRSVAAANVARRVPAVTAACLMTDRALFAGMGGLRQIYVQGDYEDTDFCLRLREAGLACWYLPDVELYHLEGQSYPSATRELSSAYNRWLHTRLWDADIEAAMEEHRAGSPRLALVGRAIGA